MSDWPIGYDLAKTVKYPTFVDGVGPYSLNASHTVANTKGSWYELTAATTLEAVGIIVEVVAQSQEIESALFDIAIGGVGNEIVILENLTHSQGSVGNGHFMPAVYEFPITIPKGTRISVRSQSTFSGSSGVHLGIKLLQGGFGQNSPLAGVLTYGANIGTSQGVYVYPSATIDTKGSWFEIIPSLDIAAKGLILGINSLDDNDRASAEWSVDVGAGSSGNEEVLVSDFLLRCHSNTDIIIPINSPFIAIQIPKSTRISVRAACTINSASDKVFSAVIYTVY